MNAPVTRRALLGASTAVLGAVSAVGMRTAPSASTPAHAALSANDARLVALVDAYEGLERACRVHTEAVRGLSPADQDEEGFHEIARHFVPTEDEATETLADTMTGVLAKARLCQTRGVRECENFELTLSLADDVWRLFGSGAAASS